MPLNSEWRNSQGSCRRNPQRPSWWRSQQQTPFIPQCKKDYLDYLFYLLLTQNKAEVAITEKDLLEKSCEATEKAHEELKQRAAVTEVWTWLVVVLLPSSLTYSFFIIILQLERIFRDISHCSASLCFCSFETSHRVCVLSDESAGVGGAAGYRKEEKWRKCLSGGAAEEGHRAARVSSEWTKPYKNKV